MGAYKHSLTHMGHTDSVNAIAFSPDGRFLASGGDDTALFISEVAGERKTEKMSFSCPITALRWSPQEEYPLYIGLADGRIVTAVLSQPSESNTPWRAHCMRLPCREPIEDIDVDSKTGRLAVCSVSTVELVLPLKDVDECLREALPDCTGADSQIGGFTTCAPRAAIFTENGKALLVVYLDHGIRRWDISAGRFTWAIQPRSARIGRAGLSPDGRIIAVSNLYDGFDLYSTIDQTHLQTIKADIRVNLPLPVVFIGECTLLLGTTCGAVRIRSIVNGADTQVINCDQDIVQAVASWSHPAGRMKLLAYGSAEAGHDTAVVVWESEVSTSLPTATAAAQDALAKRRNKSATERMHEEERVRGRSVPIGPYGWVKRCVLLTGWLFLVIVAVLPVFSWSYRILPLLFHREVPTRILASYLADAPECIMSFVRAAREIASKVYGDVVHLCQDWVELVVPPHTAL